MLHKSLIVMLFIILSSLPALADDKALPPGIAKQLPKSYTVMTYMCGTLKEIKQKFCIVVGQNSDAEEKSVKDGIEGPDRPAFIFTAPQGGSFTLSERNNDVVMPSDTGGQCDSFDPADGLAVKGNFFTIQNGVACGDHWTDYITFRYDTKLHDWVFHKRIYQSYGFNPEAAQNSHAEALKKTEEKVENEKLNAPITFERYNR